MGHPDVVRLLLQNDATADSRNNDGWTPLILASENGHLDVVRLLLQNGAAIDSCHNNDEGIQPDGTDKQSFCTSLHPASTKGHFAVVELLIQHGADVDARNQSQETPLHLASAHGQLKIAHLLLSSGSHVNSRDNEDSTPLHKAAQNGHLDVVTLLLKSGAIPLDLASHHERSDVARLLAELMGVTDSQVLTDVTHSHTAPRDSLPQVAQLPIGHGEGTNSSDKRTTLHAALEAGDVVTMRSLLDGGADVSQRDEFHRTLVYWASRSAGGLK